MTGLVGTPNCLFSHAQAQLSSHLAFKFLGQDMCLIDTFPFRVKMRNCSFHEFFFPKICKEDLLVKIECIFKLIVIGSLKLESGQWQVISHSQSSYKSYITYFPHISTNHITHMYVSCYPYTPIKP